MKKLNMVKRIRANIKNVKETCENVSSDTLFYGEKCVISISELEKAPTIDDIYIIHRPDIIMVNGCTIALATSVELNGKIYNVICTDNLFNCFDTNTQEFVINHEIGHHKHNHIKKIIEMGLNDNKEYIKNRLHGDGILMEYEADAYAVSRMGKKAAEDGIRNLYKNFGFLACMRNRSEFQKRFNKISKM